MRNDLDFFDPFRGYDKFIKLATDFGRDWSPTGNHFLEVNIDVDENNNYIIKAEVPGVNEENITVSFENGIVSLTAEYKEEDKHVFRAGKYSRSFRLDGVDAEKIEAKLDKGILSVILPKAENQKPRKVKIN